MGVRVEEVFIRREAYQARHRSRFRDNYRKSRILKGSLIGVGAMFWLVGWIPVMWFGSKLQRKFEGLIFS